MKKKAAKATVKRRFVLCPQCNSKSKVLRSEFGGFQTRKCQSGHYFEWDKWIADRMVWVAITTGRIPNPYGK